MEKMKKYTIEGGFHNAGERNFFAPDFTSDGGDWKDALEWFIVHKPDAYRKLYRHFCPSHDCTCGGPQRAEEV